MVAEHFLAKGIQFPCRDIALDLAVPAFPIEVGELRAKFVELLVREGRDLLLDAL